MQQLANQTANCSGIYVQESLRKREKTSSFGQNELYGMFSLNCAATELGGLQMVFYQYNNRWLWGKLRVLNVLKSWIVDGLQTCLRCISATPPLDGSLRERHKHSVGQTQERPFKKESSSLQARISCVSQSEAFIFAALQAFADVWVQYCLCLPCRLLLSLLILNHICSFLDIWTLKLEVFRCCFSVLWHVGGQSSAFGASGMSVIPKITFI